MLQHDRKPALRPLHGLDRAARPHDCAVDRLFQQHMLAGGSAALDEFEMRIGRCQDHCDLDRAILENALEIIRHWVAVSCREGFAPLRARGVASSNLDAVGELLEAPDVRLQGHAEADDSETTTRAHRADRPSETMDMEAAVDVDDATGAELEVAADQRDGG